MRLWTLHPRYLDPRGLVALWREALLAQAVLAGRTRGYTQHPQLARFRESNAPLGAIGSYLVAVEAEARQRGYRFDTERIGPDRCETPIPVSDGQLAYEREHLLAKLRIRAPDLALRFARLERIQPHPLFRIVPGGIAAWEATSPAVRRTG